jgi:hypothetical protein
MADKYDLIVVGAGPGEERGGASPPTAPPTEMTSNCIGFGQDSLRWAKPTSERRK